MNLISSKPSTSKESRHSSCGRRGHVKFDHHSSNRLLSHASDLDMRKCAQPGRSEISLNLPCSRSNHNHDVGMAADDSHPPHRALGASFASPGLGKAFHDENEIRSCCSNGAFDSSINRKSSKAASCFMIKLPRYFYRHAALAFALFLLLTTFAAGHPIDSNDSDEENDSEMPDFSKVPTPPKFIHERNDAVMFFAVNAFDQRQQQDNNGNGNGNIDTLNKATLKCQAKGYPDVSYRWERNGRPFATDDARRITKVAGEGTIVLSKLQVDDAGGYRCFASNDNGTAVDAEILLNQTYVVFNDKPKAPDTFNVSLGDSFQQTCTAPANSVPKASVFWILKNQQDSQHELRSMSNDQHIAQDNQGTIYFTYIEEADAQLRPKLYYSCLIENPISKEFKQGRSFGLNILKDKRKSLNTPIGLSKMFVSDYSQVVVHGATLYLHCIYSGYPAKRTIPSWSKESGQLSKDRASFNSANRQLQIKNVTFDDAGTYNCEIYDEGVRHTFYVTVESAPFWKTVQPNRNVSEDEKVEFICGAEGIPRPSFRFFKNGKEVTNNDNVYVRDNKLVIQQVRKKSDDYEGDNGVYQCEATNKHGKIWANFYLNILSFRPYIQEGPDVVREVIGATVELHCKVFGSPMPTVSWAGSHKFQSHLHRLSEVQPDADGNAKLIIRNAQEEFEGDYVCSAKNKLGTADATGSLKLKKATQIKEAPHDQVVYAGEDVSFRCSAAHDPDLRMDISWLFKDSPVTIDGQRIMLLKEDAEILYISRTLKSDDGIYTCQAKTELDTRSRAARLTVKDVPQAPSLVAANCTGRSAVIRWTNFDEEYLRDVVPVLDFIVQYQNFDPDSNDQQQSVVNGWESLVSTMPAEQGTQSDQVNMRLYSMSVTLEPFANYRFRVIARNEVGESAPSEPSVTRCKMAAAAPDSNPRNVEVKGTTSNDITVSWDPMPRKEWNGPKFHYKIRYRKKGAEEWKEVSPNDPDLSEVVIEDEIDGPYTPYEVQVKAVNEVGESQENPAVVEGHSGEGRPTEIPGGFMFIEAPHPTVAKFKWNPVSPESVNGNFRGYRIVHWAESKKRGADDEKKEAYFDPEVTSGAVYDLKPFRENSAYIQVVNGAHSGPSSEIIRFTMPEGVPSGVRQLRAFALSESVVGVQWLLPREANGILCGYNVSWNTLSKESGYQEVEGEVTTAIISSPHVTHYRAMHLKAKTDYRVTVRGLTQECKAKGNGFPVTADVQTLPSGVPEVEPEQPTMGILGVSETQANVTWIPGQYSEDHNQPVGEHFYFRYRPKGYKEWYTAHPIADNFTVTLDGLSPGTTYEVVAVSVTKDNKESESSLSEIRTVGDATWTSASAGWLIAIVVSLIILIIILIIVCLVVRNRGAKYAVQEKEKAQGRQPMLAEERGFGEYMKPKSESKGGGKWRGVEEEKRSLTGGSVAESETDSMNDYADGGTGRFNEDGSFIGQYGNPNRTFVKDDATAAVAPPANNVSTFV